MKKILIISNAALNDTDSNGRTVARLLSGYEKENLAQFCVYGEPDFSLCKSYYKVTDGQALKSFLKLKPFGGVVKESAEKENTVASSGKKAGKTPLKMILRELAWGLGRWKGKALINWAKEFNPDLIFVNLGDNAFLPKLAWWLSKELNVPIVAYSTENYYFKDFNYLTRRPSLFYAIFRRILKGGYKKMAKATTLGVFNTPFLTSLYEKEFNYPCRCVFSKSEMEFVPKTSRAESPQISYLGNLGIGRHKPLIEIANALTEINPDFRLCVYGKIPNDAVKEAFDGCLGIDYKGFVSYNEVTEIIRKSDLLVHAESDDEFYNKDLMCAFSTKIADSICSGTPFFVYANSGLAETEFITKEDCAFCVSGRENLVNTLKTALFDREARARIAENAFNTAQKYFKHKTELKEILESESF